MANERAYPGYLIAFEGPEGAGRREALEHARAAIQARGHAVVVTRPLGATLAGEIYRSAAPLAGVSPRTLVLLTASDLAERLEWEILPALREGKVVLADRYVYRIVQGMARDLDPEWLEVLSAFGPIPDLVLHYYVPPSELCARLDPTTLDMYEAGMDLGLTRDIPFSYQLYHERIIDAYAQWAETHGVEMPRPESHAELVGRIERLLGLEAADVKLRHQSVMQMMLKRYHDPAHAVQVSQLACQLFNQLKAFHHLSGHAQELLEFGVLLHNVGEEGGDERNQHMRTAAMVRQSNLEGFSEAELNVIGALAAAHTIQHQRELDAWLPTVPEEYRETLRLLAPIVRLADAMDASHEQAVRWVEAVPQEGKLLVRMQSRTKARTEIRVTRERAHLMERIYGLELEIIAERQGPPPASVDLGPSRTAMLANVAS